MKRLCIILHFLTYITFFITIADCYYVVHRADVKLRLTGGNYSEIRSIPYQAQLLKDNGMFYCGAAIIESQWLISAGHCFSENVVNLTVLTGGTESCIGERHSVEEVFLHPDYNDFNLDNDISLIKLTKPMTFGEDQSAIGLSSEPPEVGAMVTISGYGTEDENGTEPSPLIKVGLVPVVDVADCRRNYSQVKDEVTSSMFCAGDGSVDSCLGDSGGPAVLGQLLVGVISAGRECASETFPGIFTAVHLYRDWISSIIGQTG